MRNRFILILLITSIILISVVTAGFGIDNEKIPVLRPPVVTSTNVTNVTNNYYNQTVNATVNETQFDNNSPININTTWLESLIESVANGLSKWNNYWTKTENINQSGYNITADYFFGDGSQLTGISSGNVENGTATGQMAFWNGTSWVNTETSELFWDDTNKRLGIGTATPGHYLNVVDDSGLGETVVFQRTGGAKGFIYNANNQVTYLYSLSLGSALTAPSITIQSGGKIIYSNTNVQTYRTSNSYQIDYYDDVIWYNKQYTAERMRLTEAGNLGIGTATPNYPLEVSGNASGITAYFENNISAEDYLYHSPFPSKDYTDSQALQDLIKVDGNGEINHSTVPDNALSIIEKPIYEKINSTEMIEVYENKTFIEKNCSYELVSKDDYQEVCIGYEVIKEVKKMNCENITKEIYTKKEDSIFLEKKEIIEEVCEPVFEERIIQIDNKTEEVEIEHQTSIGMMIGNIIKSIREIYNWNTEQDVEIQMLKSELCKKDNTYSWCLGGIIK